MALNQRTHQDKLGMTTKGRRDVDRKLDEAVEDSFPASDPVSLSHAARPRGAGPAPAMPSRPTMMLVGGGLLALIALIALRR